jgi:hypothetical protein
MGWWSGRCFLHDWGKWGSFDRTFIQTIYGIQIAGVDGKAQKFIEHWQRRVCSRCGKIQEEEI